MSGWPGSDIRSLELLFSAGTSSGLSDAELVDRFLAMDGEQSELAFEGLVLRHGPMVFDVCRKILRDSHDAEDAFQATFLVLAASARSIVKRKSVASWLHGVALRVARKAWCDAARRKAQERRIAEMTPEQVEADRSVGELVDFEALHDEIERLPRKYRDPIVLCYLEGMTLDTVATQLGCPIGTIGVRLMRARERLKVRLTRRGADNADGALIAGVSSGSVPTVLSGSLVRSTVADAVRFASGGTISLTVARLATELARSMAMTKLLKAGVAVLIVTAAVASAGGLLVRSRIMAARAQEAKEPRAQQDAAFVIDEKVVMKYPADLREGDRVVNIGRVFRIYVVEQIDAHRVRIRSANIGGWIDSSQIVRYDQAIDFYTSEIERTQTMLNRMRDGH